jgi:hypothetical protein
MRRLKASKPFLHANSNALYDYRHFDAFSADSVRLKKPAPSGSYYHSFFLLCRNYHQTFFQTLHRFSNSFLVPSGGPKGLIGPPCHGAPGRRRQKLNSKLFPQAFGDEVKSDDNKKKSSARDDNEFRSGKHMVSPGINQLSQCRDLRVQSNTQEI